LLLGGLGACGANMVAMLIIFAGGSKSMIRVLFLAATAGVSLMRAGEEGRMHVYLKRECGNTVADTKYDF